MQSGRESGIDIQFYVENVWKANRSFVKFEGIRGRGFGIPFRYEIHEEGNL